MVGTPSRWSGNGRDILSEVRNCSGDPPGGPEVIGDPLGGPEVVGRPSPTFGSGRETLREGLKWSGDPPGGPNVVGRPSGWSGSDRETFREVRKWSGHSPKVRK